MTTAQIGPLGTAVDDAVVAYVVAAQDDPTRHVTLVGEGPVTVRSDLEAVADWRERTLVATEAGAVVGVLTVDVDTELGRCYWLGPWADDDDVAVALLDAAAPLVTGAPHRVFGPDTRNTRQAALATRLGYEPGEPSAILELDLNDWQDDAATDDVRPLATAHRPTVAALHDRLFPDTHTPGERLVGDEATSILVTGSPPCGYVATQAQADGSLYVDFIGVDPGARGQGHGRALVTGALRRALADGLHHAFLTVYVSNTAARALYAAIGFVEERRTQPFTLDRR